MTKTGLSDKLWHLNCPSSGTPRGFPPSYPTKRIFGGNLSEVGLSKDVLIADSLHYKA